MVLIEDIRMLALTSVHRGLPTLVLIKALLILCVWPLPFTSRTVDDVSWLLCGVATHKALQIGLHRPTKAYEFCSQDISEYDASPQNRRLTWLACFIVNQKYAPLVLLDLSAEHRS